MLLGNWKRHLAAAAFVGAVMACSLSISFGQEPPAPTPTPDTVRPVDSSQEPPTPTPSPTPEYTPVVSFSEVIAGLKKTSTVSIFDRNQDLVDAIDSRGVGFSLSINARTALTHAGGQGNLFWAIERAQKRRT